MVVSPGAGSELYRGLGSVVVGGLALSALLTLLIVPPMLAMLIGPIEGRKVRTPALGDPGRRDQLAAQPGPAAGE